MTIQELFIRSNQELKLIVDQIDKSQWGIDMPVGTASRPANLADSVCYHIYDDAWVPDVLDGKTIRSVGHAHEPILATPQDQIKQTYAKNNAAAIEKVRSWTDLDRTVHLSYGDFSADDYLQHIISFRWLRCYDIAKLIGVDTKLPADFVQALWDEFGPVIGAYRKMGVFPAAVVVPKNSDLQTKLLALVGRK